MYIFIYIYSSYIFYITLLFILLLLYENMILRSHITSSSYIFYITLLFILLLLYENMIPRSPHLEFNYKELNPYNHI